MMRSFQNLWLVVGLLLILMATSLCAQPKPGYAPSSTHVFPAGGRRGTTVNVRVGGECIPPKTNFAIFGVGLDAPTVLGARLPFEGEPSPRRLPTESPITYPREWSSQLTIAADAPLGPAYWRLSCAQGGTGSRPFIVGELPEFVESESNSQVDRAEHVTLPVTINGQICGERDVDYFRFAAKAGQTVVCEVFAGRLGSRLDPIVELLDQEGQKIQFEQTHRGSDPVLAFQAGSDGEFVLRVAEISTYGSPAHVYRIKLTTQPFVLFAFPAGGQAGTERTLDLFTMSGCGRAQLINRKVRVPTGHIGSLSPQNFSGIALDVDDLPNQIENEPNNRTNAATKISKPITIDGRFDTADDQDWFEFKAAKDERLAIVCWAASIGSSASPTILLTDASDKQLASTRAVESNDSVCRIEKTIPDSGVYRLRVRDLRHGAMGGQNFIYRLSIRTATPSFSLRFASDCINVMQGKGTSMKVAVDRTGGFEDAIDLHVDGLPSEVKVKNPQIPAGKSKFKLEFSATENAVAGNSTLTIVGASTVNGQVLQRIALAKHLGVDSEGIAVTVPTLDRLHLTVQHKPLFRLYCAEAYMYAHRGSVYQYAMEVERLNDFSGDIVLEEGDRQNRDMDGVQIWNATIAPSDSTTYVPIYLPESMHINVQSQSQLYTQAWATFTDKQGRPQSFLVLSEKRNMLRTLPPVVKLRVAEAEISVKRGKQGFCRFRLERTTNFSGEMELELVDTPFGVSAEPTTIPAGKNSAQMAIGLAEDVSDRVATLRFRATGTLPNGTVVITEDSVTLSTE